MDDKRPSTVLIGMSGLFVVLGLLFIAFGIENGAAVFGVILLGIGVVIGLGGAVLSWARR